MLNIKDYSEYLKLCDIKSEALSNIETYRKILLEFEIEYNNAEDKINREYSKYILLPYETRKRLDNELNEIRLRKGEVLYADGGEIIDYYSEFIKTDDFKREKPYNRAVFRSLKDNLEYYQGGISALLKELDYDVENVDSIRNIIIELVKSHPKYEENEFNAKEINKLMYKFCNFTKNN